MRLATNKTIFSCSGFENRFRPICNRSKLEWETYHAAFCTLLRRLALYVPPLARIVVAF